MSAYHRIPNGISNLFRGRRRLPKCWMKSWMKWLSVTNSAPIRRRQSLSCLPSTEQKRPGIKKQKLAIVSKSISDHRDSGLRLSTQAALTAWWFLLKRISSPCVVNIYKPPLSLRIRQWLHFREVGDDAYCGTILRFYFTFWGVFLCSMTDARGT